MCPFFFVLDEIIHHYPHTELVDVALDGDGDDEYDDDSDATPVGTINGRSKGKGKAVMGFQDGTASDDDGLY